MANQLAPEQRARQRIDAALADAGWIAQDRDTANVNASRGVAIREFRMQPGHGFADYLLFLDGQAVGAFEAKPEGFALSSAHRPLPFLYLGNGVETRFAEDLRDALGQIESVLSDLRTRVR